MHANNTNYEWATVYNKANKTDVAMYLSKDPRTCLVVKHQAYGITRQPIRPARADGPEYRDGGRFPKLYIAGTTEI